MKKIARYLPMLLLCASASAADVTHIRSMAASCAGCHGTNGVAEPGMASLAGKSKDDIQKSMLDYKSGNKPATLMHQLAKGYSDEQIEQLAIYFSSLKK
jgi:cytochrome subunit of sulfide dehydrogenase